MGHHVIDAPARQPGAVTTPEQLVAPLRRYREAMSAALLAEDHPPVPPAAKWLLLELAREKGTVNDLAARQHIAKQAVSRLAERLVALGYCDRQRSSTDRRQVWLSLTDEGRHAATVLLKAVEELDRRLFADIGDAERRTFEAVLRRLGELPHDASAAPACAPGT